MLVSLQKKMVWIERYIEKHLSEYVRPGKVMLLFGPRRVGKTSLIEKYLKENYNSFFIGSGDDINVRDVLSSENPALIISAFKNYEVVFIDEAQRIPEVGWGLKILVDSIRDAKIIASGSSSFDLSNKTGEPLTGRNIICNLYPVSLIELDKNYGGMHVMQNLENYLIFGTYPETIQAPNFQEKAKYLNTLRNSYLFKDILELENVRNPDKLNDLLKLVAFQIGNEVSLNELANSLGIAKQTVERYLDLLEKTYIIFKVRAFSGNLRKEISKSARYYFWDNGIRNSVINNFSLPDARMDMGMLWENFCYVERMKKQKYKQIFSNNYFWRTYDRQEIDLVEEREGKLFAYEFKWSHKRTCKVPDAFAGAYKNISFECVTPKNFMEFLI